MFNLFIIIFFFSSVISYSQNAKENDNYSSEQSGFFLKGSKKRDRIPFRLVNNLPIVEVEINGTPLSFILDTGVKSTILLSFKAADSLQFGSTSPIFLQGLGPGGAVKALKSLHNLVKVGNVVDPNHSLYTIFDSSLDFSPRMGISIDGILGNDFFENFIVKINYTSKIITVLDPNKYDLRKCKKCEELALGFVENKPYIFVNVASKKKQKEVKLLLDSGSSDAVWLFDDEDFIEESPRNYFNDFLGLGLSGNIYGKRSRIFELIIGDYHLKELNTSFPDENATIKARYYQDRDGSLGGGFLSRFTVTFDYGNKLVRFKKNRKFKSPFNHNMSGLTLEQDGVQLVKNETHAVVYTNKNYDNFIKKNVSLTPEVYLSLAPKYVVADVREDSPAELAGILKGDEIVSINGKPCYEYKLLQLIELFSSESGKRINMEVSRGGFISKKIFYLKNELF